MNYEERSNHSIPALEDIAERITDPIKEGPPDLIPGLLPRSGQLVIAGSTNVGKSLVSLEIASALVTGSPLWGELVPTAKVNKILYVLGEHYNDIIRRLHRVTKLPLTDQVFILGPEQLTFDKWLVAGGRPNTIAIDKFKKWADGCGLIIFDPLSAFLTGAEGEQDNITMRLVLDSMSLIAQASGASSLILAHQGKPMLGKDGAEYARTSYAIRGASAIEDAATNIFYLGKSDDAAARVSEGLILELRLRKYKGLAPDRYLLHRDPTTLTHTLLGEKAYDDVQRMDIRNKVFRIQSHNPKIDYRTAIRLVAAMLGKPEKLVQKWAEEPMD